MKKLIGIFILVAAVAFPSLAQWSGRLSPQDQQRFDSYYSRWQDYQQHNDRDQMRGMEDRMHDIYARYNIPAQTPFWRVASNGQAGRERNPWRGRLSPDDQQRFDSYFSRWQDSRQRNDGDQMRSMENRMRDIYEHYSIPADTPFSMVASNSGDRDWNNYERNRWHGRLSADDQQRFDSYYRRWLEYRRHNDGDQVRSMEKRMQELMSRYNIPSSVPYDQIASR